MDYEARQIHIKREKAKARALRQSGWWQSKSAKAVCYYCQQAISTAEVTMDHILPLSRGGFSTKGNIVTACKSCNVDKRDQLPLEWMQLLANEIAATKDSTAGTQEENH